MTVSSQKNTADHRWYSRTTKENCRFAAIRQNWKKNHLFWHSLVLSAYVLLIVGIYIGTGNVYGSSGDWLAQHTELPNYMRTLFYQTGRFFPDYAMSLGLGQNIYYISYYGLFSPVVLFSYLLPFVDMQTYMTAASVVMVILSVILINRWLSGHLGVRASFVSAALFTFAGPLIFESHHHLMFVIYMPFLILAMEGMEKWIGQKKRVQLIISSALVILCCYYFAVSAMLVLCIYGIALYLDQAPKPFQWLDFIRTALCTIWVFLIPVLISAVLWLPTLYVLTQGRAVNKNETTWQQLFLPEFQADTFLYSNLSMGLTAVFVLAVLYSLISRKRGQIFSGVIFLCMMCFGIFVYELNGGMYFYGKVLIPFLPLAVLLIGRYLEAAAKRKFRYWRFVFLSAAFSVFAFFTFQGSDTVRINFILDMAFSLLITAGIYYGRKLGIVLAGALLLPVSFFTFSNNMDEAFLTTDRNLLSFYKDADTLVKYAENREPHVVRMGIIARHNSTMNHVFDTGYLTNGIYSSLNNSNYRDYYFHHSGNEISNRSNAIITTNSNLLNALQTGEKYMILDDDSMPIPGYKKVAEKGSASLYCDKDVEPIGYASKNGKFRPDYKKVAFRDDFCWKLRRTGAKKMDDGRIKVIRNTPVTFSMPIRSSSKDRVMQFRMRVDNSSYKKAAVRKNRRRPVNTRSGEVRISINGIHNKLSSPNWRYFNNNYNFTFTVFIPAGEDEVEITMGSGRYILSDISARAFDYDQYRSWRKSVDPWKLDRRKTVDNRMTGKIHVKEKSQMVLNIPYDNGYTITVDHKPVTYHKDKYGMIVFPAQKGHHQMDLVFHAPWKREGIILSAAGLMLLIGTAWHQRREQKKRRR